MTISISEVKNKLSQRLILNETETGMRGQFMSKLDAALNEVSPYAFEYEGKVWICLCDRQETDTALFERCLSQDMACGYAAPGVSSCYQCGHLMFIMNNAE